MRLLTGGFDLLLPLVDLADVVLRLPRPVPLGELREGAELTLDPAELGGHDGHIDQQQEQEDEVGPADVAVGALDREQRAHAGASRARRIRLRFPEAAFASSSNQTSVLQRSAIPARQTRKANSIESGSPPADEKVRGWISGWARRTARKLSGTKAPAVIANTDA